MPSREGPDENAGRSAAEAVERPPVERYSGGEASLVPDQAGAGPGTRRNMLRSFAPTWLAPIALVILASAGFAFVRGSPGAAAPACTATDWRTELTVDKSRPELATTTLRSRNAIGSRGREGCAEVTFACAPDGPYFELRLSAPAPAMRQVGPIEMRNLNDDLAAQVFAPPAGAQTSVRVADKEKVELIAYAVANSLAFRIPVTFADGGSGAAEFKSYHFSTAVRPVLFACNMRALQLEQPSDDDE